MKQWLIIFPIRVYVNEKYIRIIIKINTRYYLKLGMPETMTLLGSTKNKITKDENGENVTHWEIAEVV